MPRGSNVQKGQRPTGRAKGTPNRRTVERLEQERIAQQAQEEVNKAHHQKTKLGKDVLEEFMKTFAGMAAQYQPWPASMGVNPLASESKFLVYARLTVETARDLAAFQSPKFKAIQIVTPPPAGPPVRAGEDNVLTIDDPQALARVYARMVKQVR